MPYEPSPLTDVDAGDLHRKAASGMVYTALSQGLKAVLSIVSQIVLSRLLLPAEFGVVAMAAPVLAFVSLFTNLSLSQAIVQKEKITQAEISTLFWVAMAASSTCALVVIGISPLISLLYHQPSVGPVCAILALQMPLGALASHSSALMSRRLRFKALALMEVMTGIAVLVSSIVSALWGCGYWSLVIGQLFGGFVGAIGDRTLSGWWPSRPAWTPSAAPMLRFGANLTGFSVLSMFSLYSDNVLIGILRGPAALGLFDKAFALVLRPISSITAPLSRVATPLLSRMINDPVRYRETFISLLQGSILLTAPGLVVGFLHADIIVRTILGPHWTNAAPIISFICLAGMFTPLSGSSSWMFTSQNRPNEQLKCGAVSSGLILVSMLFGLPWGSVGVAAAYAVFAPAVHGYFIWVAARVGPVGRRAVTRGLYPFIVCLPAGGLAVVLLSRVVAGPPLLMIAVDILLAYMVSTAVMLATPEGRRAALAFQTLIRRDAAQVTIKDVGAVLVEASALEGGGGTVF